MKLFLLILLILIFIILLLGFFRTWQVQNSPNQKKFLAGKIPNPSLNGFLKGTVTGYHGNWQGKKFNVQQSTGINIFKDNAKETTAYPFKTYTGQGLQDPKLKVLKIDYNIPENPFWAKFILDELVQTAPGKYLGKLNIKILPGLSFALGFFQLEK